MPNSLGHIVFATLIAISATALAAPRVCLAQAPTGTIGGTVRDPAGGVVSGAQIQAVSHGTGHVRTTSAGPHGDYSFAALLPGTYDVRADAAGFQRRVRVVGVEAGTTTRADIVLRVGDVHDAVDVHAVVPLIHYDSAAIGGVILRDQIERLPLNGRGFLELAKLEPGVQPPTTANRNRTIVPILGAPASNIGGARFTVDGGSVSAVAMGGSQMGLSQEVVQEFQVSTVSFDLAAGMTDAGTINVVTRAGGNTLQATTFHFFRDHNLAAYPALQRDPNNSDPFFRRRQFGFSIGGPIRRDRVSYFGTWERNDQRAVASTALLAPDFAHLSRVTATPSSGDLLSVRVDASIAAAHHVFVRHSYDANHAFGPTAAGSGGSPNAYPSNWPRSTARSEQSLIALTSVLTPTMINDLRLSFFMLRSRIAAAGGEECAGCLGLASPSISIPQAGLLIGNSTAVDNRVRRLHFNDAMTWHAGTHRVRAGIDWELNRERNHLWNNQPAAITLFPPDRIRAYNSQPGVLEAQRIPLPAAFRTLDDILQLPLQTVNVGVGEPGVLQEGGGDVRRWNTLWLYAEDAWRLRQRFTLTYGLGWGVDGTLNHDLSKPLLLAPLLGAGGLGPTRNNWTNFSPRVGAVWMPSSDGATVIRAAAGRFYRPHGLTSSMDAERLALGPPGLGRQTFPGSSILNCVPGIPGVPLGTPLEFRNTPTFFTGANFLAILPAIRDCLAQGLTRAADGVRQIEITKQTIPAIFPVNVPNAAAVHANVGFQRELGRGVVLSADVVYRHFSNVPQGGGSIDVNHFNSVRGPAVPRCSTTAEASDPRALCSLGPINVQIAPYRFTYKGVLARIEKRLSHRFQVLGSYAYSRNSGTNAGNGFSLDDWRANTGPAPNDFTHVLNVAGVLPLPWQFDLGFNFSYASPPPFSAFVGGVDLNGDGTTGDLLPGTTVNAFNRGMRRGELEQLVVRFNGLYAGTRDDGTVIPRLILPARYSTGDNFHALDLRFSRRLVLGPRLRLSLIAEVFNVYNGSNLSGFSGDLTGAAFGQPTSRATQVFGSGGTRAFQLGARASF